jgi:hypothetical protein
MAEPAAAAPVKQQPPKRARAVEENTFGHAILKMRGYADEHFLVPITAANTVYRAQLDTMGRTEGEFELADITHALDKAGGHSIGTKRASLKSGQVVATIWTIYAAANEAYEVDSSDDDDQDANIVYEDVAEE